jgi:hypothetical protein
MILFHVFFPFSIPFLRFTRGKIAVQNIINTTGRGTLALISFNLFVIVLLFIFTFVILPADSVTNHANLDLTVTISAFVIFVMSLTLRYAFLPLEEEREIYRQVLSNGKDLFPSVYRLLKPSDSLIWYRIKHAEVAMGIDASQARFVSPVERFHVQPHYIHHFLLVEFNSNALLILR